MLIELIRFRLAKTIFRRDNYEAIRSLEFLDVAMDRDGIYEINIKIINFAMEKAML